MSNTSTSSDVHHTTYNIKRCPPKLLIFLPILKATVFSLSSAQNLMSTKQMTKIHTQQEVWACCQPPALVHLLRSLKSITKEGEG